MQDGAIFLHSSSAATCGGFPQPRASSTASPRGLQICCALWPPSPLGQPWRALPKQLQGLVQASSWHPGDGLLHPLWKSRALAGVLSG